MKHVEAGEQSGLLQAIQATETNKCDLIWTVMIVSKLRWKCHMTLTICRTGCTPVSRIITQRKTSLLVWPHCRIGCWAGTSLCSTCILEKANRRHIYGAVQWDPIRIQPLSGLHTSLCQAQDRSTLRVFIHLQHCHICQICFIPWHLHVHHPASTNSTDSYWTRQARFLCHSTNSTCGTHYLPN